MSQELSRRSFRGQGGRGGCFVARIVRVWAPMTVFMSASSAPAAAAVI